MNLLDYIIEGERGAGFPKGAESTATQAPELNSGDRGGLAESEGLALRFRVVRASLISLLNC